jgi:PAS domain S-box-containing protein
MDDFHRLTHVPLAIIDLQGTILVSAGWSEVCIRFHRVNPESRAHCLESDVQLSAGVPEGEFKLYKCKNNMWDIATPIFVEGRHRGNIFSGQFFFEDETLDRELFRAQARRFGFDEDAYLRAVEATPQLSRETVSTAMSFFAKLAGMLSQLGYSTTTLSRALADRDRLTASLEAANERIRQNEARLNRAQEIAHLGSWELNLVTNQLTWSDEVYRIFGLDPQKFGATYEAFLERVHPEDRLAVDEAYTGSLSGGWDSYEIKHRVVRAHTGEIRYVHEKCQHERDLEGKVIRSVGMVHDITELMKAEQEREALLAQERELNTELATLSTENERLYRQQLEIAESLQSSLLHIPSELGPVRLSHLYRSATEAAHVGGDFYDVFEVKDGKIAVLIGDVAGHGIQAARAATLVKDVVHAFIHQSLLTHEVLSQTNRLLIEKKDLPGFVTVFLGILDPDRGHLRYSSAGHPYGFLKRASGDMELLGSGSSPLGVFDDASWNTGEVAVGAGDLLLLYTDGVTEARNDGELFGEARLAELLRTTTVDSEHLPDLILDEVLAFSDGTLQDDIAILAVRLTNTPTM